MHVPRRGHLLIHVEVRGVLGRVGSQVAQVAHPHQIRRGPRAVNLRVGPGGVLADAQAQRVQICGGLGQGQVQQSGVDRAPQIQELPDLIGRVVRIQMLRVPDAALSRGQREVAGGC